MLFRWYKKVFSNISLLFCLILLINLNDFSAISAEIQELKAGNDYLSLYAKENYKESLKIISDRLSSIYRTKNGSPFTSDYFLSKKDADKKNISILFNKRKADSFFIEDNKELFDLHLYAARCYNKLGESDASLNHYFVSIRYNPSDIKKDEIIFYEISQVYKSLNFLKAYADSLETAYTLNPLRFEYSLELGKALSITNEKKKAIYHLKRYIESRDNIEDPALFLTIGNLNEDIGQYLETVKYYKKYLEKKADDGNVNYALGYLTYYRTGNHLLAMDCFDKAIKYLPENDYRRSKALEFQADIYFKDLEYEKAVQLYIETKKYHDKIQTGIDENNKNIRKMDDEISKIRSSLDSQKPVERYSAYENLQSEKGKLELANREMKYNFEKINAGKIRWNIALSYERLENLEEAIQYYNEAISFDYNTGEARDRIKKLKLKIKRGY